MTDKLIAQVKRKLNITWNDDDTNNRVQEIIQSAIPYMIHILGITDPEFDFSEYGVENTLFLAYCLYEWNHATNEFAVNYANIIAQTRAKYEVAYYQESEGSADE